MREVFAHDAILQMEPGADLGAPGASVTKALCGRWDHEPPCPLAPHHSHAVRAGSQVTMRILFAIEQDQESPVRHSIESALATGHLDGPDGVTVRWRLVTSGPGDVRTEEMDHARRLQHH